MHCNSCNSKFSNLNFNLGKYYKWSEFTNDRNKTKFLKKNKIVLASCRFCGLIQIKRPIEAKKISESKWEAYTDNGRQQTGLDVIEWAKIGVDKGAGEILLTSIDTEGTGKGFDYELIKKVSDKCPNILPWKRL